jgi:hypothetical protein
MTRRRKRYNLSDGGRPKALPDYVELIIARRIGRDLTTTEGCAVQIVALLVFGVLVYWAFASGLVTWIAGEFARWYTSQIHLGPSPRPSP